MKLHEAMILATSDYYEHRHRGLCFWIKCLCYANDKISFVDAMFLIESLSALFRADAGLAYYWELPSSPDFDPEARLIGGCLVAELIRTGDIDEIFEQESE